MLSDKLKNIVLFLLVIVIATTLISFLLDSNINFSKPIVSVLSVFGFTHEGNTFIINANQIEINNFCSGLFSIVVFLAIILSPITVVSKKRRLYLVTLGSVGLYVLNIIRLLLILIFAYYTTNLETLHVAGWFFMSLAIFIIWWKWGFEKKKKQNGL